MDAKTSPRKCRLKDCNNRTVGGHSLCTPCFEKCPECKEEKCSRKVVPGKSSHTGFCFEHTPCRTSNCYGPPMEGKDHCEQCLTTFLCPDCHLYKRNPDKFNPRGIKDAETGERYPLCHYCANQTQRSKKEKTPSYTLRMHSPVPKKNAAPKNPETFPNPADEQQFPSLNSAAIMPPQPVQFVPPAQAFQPRPQPPGMVIMPTNFTGPNFPNIFMRPQPQRVQPPQPKPQPTAVKQPKPVAIISPTPTKNPNTAFFEKMLAEKSKKKTEQSPSPPAVVSPKGELPTGFQIVEGKDLELQAEEALAKFQTFQQKYKECHAQAVQYKALYHEIKKQQELAKLEI